MLHIYKFFDRLKDENILDPNHQYITNQPTFLQNLSDIDKQMIDTLMMSDWLGTLIVVVRSMMIKPTIIPEYLHIKICFIAKYSMYNQIIKDNALTTI